MELGDFVIVAVFIGLILGAKYWLFPNRFKSLEEHISV